MTTQTNSPLIQIDQEQVEKLLKVEVETLAVGFSKKTFRTVDLWNIQRQRKVRVNKTTLGQSYQ